MSQRCPDADIRSPALKCLLAPCPPRTSPDARLHRLEAILEIAGVPRRSSAGSVMLAGGSETRIPVAVLRSAEEGVAFAGTRTSSCAARQGRPNASQASPLRRTRDVRVACRDHELGGGGGDELRRRPGAGKDEET